MLLLSEMLYLLLVLVLAVKVLLLYYFSKLQSKAVGLPCVITYLFEA